MAPQSKGSQKTQIFFIKAGFKHLESSFYVVFLLLEFKCDL
jgi:hypothetical protein